MAEEEDEKETPEPSDRAEKPKKEIGTKTMFELTKSMVDKAVGVVVEQSEESDKRVADAYETGLNAVTAMAKAQQEAEEKRSARNFRLMMAFIAILGAVAIGAGAVKFFGVFELGESSEKGETYIPPHPAQGDSPKKEE